jgi:DNA-binding NtrC family response regulator
MERMPPPQNAQKTILVVDDDAGQLKLVSGLLVASSYCVMTAGTGELALQRASDHKGEIHLLLSDYQMPGMSGMALATKMVRQRPHLRVLLMSGFTDGMLILSEGWQFLPKPFIPSQLRALITGLVSPDNPAKL